MAFYDVNWYCNSVGYAAVIVRPQNTAVAAGVIRRQFTAPAVGSERCFVCIVAGTTANVADATWVLTRGAKTTDGTATWQECTGMSAVNGDLTNTVNWTAAKAIGTPTLGAIIKRNNGASYQICTTAGTMAASEPAFSDTAGVTTNDGTSVWTSLGAVGNFTGGGAPHARLANVFGTSWFIAGNTVYVGDNHAESQATIIVFTLTSSVTTVGRAICHNRLGSYPPAAGDLTTGATISTTGPVNISISATGAFYFYGLTFRLAVGQSSQQTLTLQGGSSWFYFDRCLFEIATTNASSGAFVVGGSVGGFIAFNNVTVKFANVGQNITVIGQFFWQNTGQILAAGSSVPTSLLTSATNAFTAMVLEALDLSQLTGNLISASGPSAQGNVLVKDCKLNALTTVPTPGGFGSTLQLVRCDSVATAYKSARYQYEGTETTETAITRVGGSVDPTGQAQSRKIVTTANAQWSRPFRAEPYAIWNSVIGANVTVTVYGTINAGSVPNNDDIWLTVVYLGSVLTPAGSFVRTNKVNILAAGVPLASDNSVWNGGGSGAGWSPFKLVALLSSPQPGMAGYIHARIRAAKPNVTFYIDPTVVLS